jgi:GNAT superfamily N-acetyltransferase
VDGSALSLEIRPLTAESAPAASFLVMVAFHTSVAAHYGPHGVDSFAAYADAASLTRRLRAGHRSLIAIENTRIVGLVEVRFPAHLAMLFVAPERQGAGIGTALLEHAVQLLATRDPRPLELTVNASPNAVSFYERRGFAITGPEREKDGVRFTPMRFACG